MSQTKIDVKADKITLKASSLMGPRAGLPSSIESDKDGKIIGADLKRGAKSFYQNCRPCHGEDGMRLNFNPGGSPEFIGIRARKDLPTFWYQMNFGDEDRKMEAYIDEIPVDEMRDIAAFAQTLP